MKTSTKLILIIGVIIGIISACKKEEAPAIAPSITKIIPEGDISVAIWSTVKIKIWGTWDSISCIQRDWRKGKYFETERYCDTKGRFKIPIKVWKDGIQKDTSFIITVYDSTIVVRGRVEVVQEKRWTGWSIEYCFITIQKVTQHTQSAFNFTLNEDNKIGDTISIDYLLIASMNKENKGWSKDTVVNVILSSLDNLVETIYLNPN